MAVSRAALDINSKRPHENGNLDLGHLHRPRAKKQIFSIGSTTVVVNATGSSVNNAGFVVVVVVVVHLMGRGGGGGARESAASPARRDA